MKHSDKHKSIEDYRLIQVNTKLGKSSELGKGAYGIVKSFESIHNKQIFAIKIIPKSIIKKNDTFQNVVNESLINKKLRNPFIIKLHNFFEDEKNVYLVFDYAENGNLFDYLGKKKRKFLKEQEAMFFVIQIIIAVNYIHSKQILHRDIKPENILLDKKGNIKLSDFGWSALKDKNKRTTMCGTIDYMAPEIIKNQKYDETVDIWSIGVLLYELTQGYPPFSGNSFNEKVNNLNNFKIENFKNKLSDGCKEFLYLLLKVDPTERIKPNEIEKLPYIQNFCKKYNVNLSRYLNKDNNLSDLSIHFNDNSLLNKSNNTNNKLINKSVRIMNIEAENKSNKYINKSTKNINNLSVNNKTNNNNKSKITIMEAEDDMEEEMNLTNDQYYDEVYDKRGYIKKKSNFEFQNLENTLKDFGIENENLDLLSKFENVLDQPSKKKKTIKSNKKALEEREKINKSRSKSKKKFKLFDKKKKYTANPKKLDNKEKLNLNKSNINNNQALDNKLKGIKTIDDILESQVIENNYKNDYSNNLKINSNTIEKRNEKIVEKKNDNKNKYHNPKPNNLNYKKMDSFYQIDNDNWKEDEENNELYKNINQSKYFKRQNSIKLQSNIYNNIHNKDNKNSDIDNKIKADKIQISEKIIEENNNYKKQKKSNNKNKKFSPKNKLEKINKDDKFYLDDSLGKNWLDAKDYKSDLNIDFIPKNIAYKENPLENQFNDIKNQNQKIKDFLDILEDNTMSSRNNNPKERLNKNYKNKKRSKEDQEETNFFIKQKNNINKAFNSFLISIGCLSSRNN